MRKGSYTKRLIRWPAEQAADNGATQQSSSAAGPAHLHHCIQLGLAPQPRILWALKGRAPREQPVQQHARRPDVCRLQPTLRPTRLPGAV